MAITLISSDELSESLENIKSEIGMDVYGKTLDELIFYLKGQVILLEKLKSSVVAEKRTLLRNCIDSSRIMAVLSGSREVFINNKITPDLNKLTLEEFSKMPIIELTKFFGMTEHNIYTLKKVMKKAGLRFKK